MSDAAAQTQPARLPAVAARIDMVAERPFPLPDATLQAVDRIRAITGNAARDLVTAIEGANAYDTGRLIAALDHLQQTKHIACDAVTLPHHPKKQ